MHVFSRKQLENLALVISITALYCYKSIGSSFSASPNYIDESTLMHLSKKAKYVSVLLLTKKLTQQLLLDIDKINKQYEHFEARIFLKSHDRFLIIDNDDIYHLGASLKDLGKKWFAFSKMDKVSVESILNQIDDCRLD